jgi:hypothetical protein
MLPLPNLEAIQAQFLELPSILRAYEEGDSEFPERARAWLNRLEAALEDNRLPNAGAVAGLRGLIVSAERGAIPPGLSFLGTPNLRKLREAAAAEALRRAEETVSSSLRADIAQFDEAARFMRQMVAVALHRGLLSAGMGAATHSEAVNAIWSAFLSDADLAPGTTRVTGLVGSHNALFLLSRELPPEMS